MAASTSALTMRPRGPLPVIWLRSRPFCSAIRRASGEAKMRVPSGFCGGGGAAFSGPPAGAASAAAPACALGAVAGGASAMSAALSPSSSSTAIGVLTFTASVPSATRILPITPSSTASNSIVALSVSISAITSPERTSSPSLTSHLASVPSSIVGDRAGMRISVGIFDPPLSAATAAGRGYFCQEEAASQRPSISVRIS